MVEDIGRYVCIPKTPSDLDMVASAKALEDVMNFVHAKLVEHIRADPEFQRLMAEEDARIIALYEQVSTDVPPRSFVRG